MFTFIFPFNYDYSSKFLGIFEYKICFPFCIIGFILGVIGAIVPILLTIYGYTFLYDFIGGKLFTELVVLVQPSEIIYTTSLALLVAGGMIGMSGSVKAVRKYLKI